MWLLFGHGQSLLGCAKGDVAMSTILKVINLTGVCSSFAVAASCFVGVYVAGGSKSNSILVLAKAMLTLSGISPSCFLPPKYQSVACCYHGQDSKMALLFSYLIVQSTACGQASTHIG